MGKMIDELKKIKIINDCINIEKKIKFYIENKKLENEKHKRIEGWEDVRFQKIKEYHNRYAGERCFIVAMGPSLTLEDLDKIKDEYTFGMNSICLKFKEFDWKPTFYGIQDKYVYDKIKADVNKIKDIPVFIGSTIKDSAKRKENWYPYPLNTAYHEYQSRVGNYFAKVSRNSYEMVYDGYSIAYSLIQIAIYMGFKEIYLIGNDCNYETGRQQHFVEYGYIDKNYKTVGNKMIVAYEDLWKEVQNTDIKIYNATRGGMLEVFPRVNLDKII